MKSPSFTTKNIKISHALISLNVYQVQMKFELFKKLVQVAADNKVVQTLHLL